MKILHINTNDIDGGAARSAYRLHIGLCANGMDSIFFVQKKNRKEYDVISTSGKINRLLMLGNSFIDRAIKSLLRINTKTPWSINRGIYASLVHLINGLDVDIINLHWINGGLLPIEALSHINKPIVWTLHDSWAFTGGCHIPYDCLKYQNSCTNCEQICGRQYIDIANCVFKRKIKIYEKLDINIVTPSSWIYNCAKKSTLLKNKNFTLIPNGVNMDVYFPHSKNVCRNILKVAPNKKIILFGAMGADSDDNKGFQYLKYALNSLNRYIKGDDVEILIFGCSQPQYPIEVGYKVTYAGRLYDDISLSILYSSADVMVVPSKSENLPNTVMEALACGTPCVAFNIGGMPDMIKHKENGYLAKSFEAEDLAKGIAYILENEENWRRLSQNARNKVINSFDIDIVTKKYMDLYNEILQKK